MKKIYLYMTKKNLIKSYVDYIYNILEESKKIIIIFKSL